MSKLIKLMICLSLIVMTTALTTNRISAQDGNVTYDGNAKDFIFAPGSEYSPTDLFADFKNLMPGDSVSQKITIDNDISKEVKIKIYMKSLGADQQSQEFLSQLSLTVVQDGKTNLFDAPASETAQLTDWVYLGTLYSGGKIDLDVTVSVPITLGNDFQDAVGKLTWEFMVEELPVETTDPRPTGDNSNIYVAMTVMSVSAAALTVVLALKKKKEQEQ
ncbi:MAG: LPXTG cell wall anchor domain-containing protein [Erysipelotrichaceae bacterium]|nr:LPXTG cell wall anchor domain-containing protein [Erysipelotrichaceae bacterium]